MASKLQLKVLMGITADLDIKIDDSLAAYEGVVFANQLDIIRVKILWKTLWKVWGIIYGKNILDII